MGIFNVSATHTNILLAYRWLSAHKCTHEAHLHIRAIGHKQGLPVVSTGTHGPASLWVSWFVDNTKLFGEVNMLEGRAIWQGEIWAGWKSGWARTLSSLKKMCAKSCSWDGISKDPRAAWGSVWLGSTLLKGIWAPGGDSKLIRCQCKGKSDSELHPRGCYCRAGRAWSRTEHTSSSPASMNMNTGSNSWWVQYNSTCCVKHIIYCFLLALQCNRSFTPLKTRPVLAPNIPCIWP